jgi:hypothetical protein
VNSVRASAADGRSSVKRSRAVRSSSDNVVAPRDGEPHADHFGHFLRVLVRDIVHLGAVCPPGSAARTTAGYSRPYWAAIDAASCTSESYSARVGSAGTKMVTFRRDGGRKSATVAGATSMPSYRIAMSVSRSGFVGSRQYPSSGRR